MAVNYFINNPQEQIQRNRFGFERSVAQGTKSAKDALVNVFQLRAAQKIKDQEYNEKLLNNIDGLLGQADAFNADIIKEKVNELRSYTEKYIADGGDMDDSDFKEKIRNSTREINNISLNSKVANQLISSKIKALTPQIRNGLVSADIYETLLALNTDRDILTSSNTESLTKEIDKIVNNSIDFRVPLRALLEDNKGSQIESDVVDKFTEQDSEHDYEFHRTNTGFANYMDKTTGQLRTDLSTYLGEMLKEKVGGNYVPFNDIDTDGDGNADVLGRKTRGIQTYNTNQIIIDRAIEEYERLRYNEDSNGNYTIPQTEDPFEQAGIVLSMDSYFDNNGFSNIIAENKEYQHSKTTRTDSEYKERKRQEALLEEQEKYKHFFLGKGYKSAPSGEIRKQESLKEIVPTLNNILRKSLSTTEEELTDVDVKNLQNVRDLLDASTNANTESYTGEQLINGILTGDPRLSSYAFPQTENGFDDSVAKANKEKIKELAQGITKDDTWFGRNFEDNIEIIRLALTNPTELGEDINQENLKNLGSEIISLLGIADDTTYNPNHEYFLFEPTNQKLEAEVINFTRSSPALMSSILSKYADESSLVNFAETLYNQRETKNRPLTKFVYAE
tara:strand:+ start:155 stop:2011 length:1857 start_codon:yes stop_codon:yes gene_type:complete